MSDIKVYGQVSLVDSPTDDNDIVTKGYVDALVNTKTKPIITITGTTISPTKSGQVFYKSVSSATALTLDTSGIVFRSGEAFEFYIMISTTSSAVTFPSGWIWSGGTAPSTSGGGLFVFHVSSIDGGNTWLGELQSSFVSGN